MDKSGEVGSWAVVLSESPAEDIDGWCGEVGERVNLILMIFVAGVKLGEYEHKHFSAI